ncbi:MAG: hypothetical protein ACFE9R_21280 [Candidatus Hermodarchaeota archaeon]
MDIEILSLEMLISFLLIIGEIGILILHRKSRISGIILVGISLGVIGLLAYAVYVLFELMMFSSYFQNGMIMWAILLFVPGLIFLFLCHLALILIGRKLIRKYGKKGAEIEKAVEK